MHNPIALITGEASMLKVSFLSLSSPPGMATPLLTPIKESIISYIGITKNNFSLLTLIGNKIS